MWTSKDLQRKLAELESEIAAKKRIADSLRDAVRIMEDVTATKEEQKEDVVLPEISCDQPAVTVMSQKDLVIQAIAEAGDDGMLVSDVVRWLKRVNYPFSDSKRAGSYVSSVVSRLTSSGKLEVCGQDGRKKRFRIKKNEEA